jgi:hypothetical protein
MSMAWQDMGRPQIDAGFDLVLRYAALLPSSLRADLAALLGKLRKLMVVEDHHWNRLTEGLNDVRLQTADVDRCYHKLLPAALDVLRMDRQAMARKTSEQDGRIKGRRG